MSIPILAYANNQTANYGDDIPYNLQWVSLSVEVTDCSQINTVKHIRLLIISDIGLVSTLAHHTYIHTCIHTLHIMMNGVCSV